MARNVVLSRPFQISSGCLPLGALPLTAPSGLGLPAVEAAAPKRVLGGESRFAVACYGGRWKVVFSGNRLVGILSSFRSLPRCSALGCRPHARAAPGWHVRQRDVTAPRAPVRPAGNRSGQTSHSGATAVHAHLAEAAYWTQPESPGIENSKSRFMAGFFVCCLDCPNLARITTGGVVGGRSFTQRCNESLVSR